MLRMVLEAIFSPVKYSSFTLLLAAPYAIIELILTRNSPTLIQMINSHFPIDAKLGLENNFFQLISNIEILVLVLAILLALSIVIRLHQKIITGKSQWGFSLLPGHIEITYGLYIIVISVLIYLFSIAIFIGGPLLHNQLTSYLNSIPEAVPYMYVGDIIGIIVGIIIALVLTQILLRIMLSFPRVSVDREIHKWTPIIRQHTFLLSSSGRAVILVMAISSIPLVALQLAGEYLQHPPLLSSDNKHILAMVVAARFYAAFALIAIITIVYRDHVIPFLPPRTTSDGQDHKQSKLKK